MSDIYNEFKIAFKYYADYYRFLELNDERVYNYIIDTVNKNVENPSINDLVNMTIKVYYKQAKVRFLQDNKYLLNLFKQHFIESDIIKSLENINLIIVKAKYELTFENCLLILSNYPSIKTYIKQNDGDSLYLLKKLREIIELENEEAVVEEEIDDSIDFVAKDNMEAYLNEINNYPVLSWEEQLVLANKMVTGDKNAREELIKSNLRLVIFIAKKYIDRGLEFLDLIEAGNEGLLKAVNRFDPKLGYRFTTYASWWIRQSIQRSIFNEGRTVRVPVHYAERINQFTKELRSLELKIGRDPSFKEMLINMDYSEDELKSFLLHTGMISSLNIKTGGDNDGDEIQEFIPDETNVENQVLDKDFFNGAIKIMQKILNDKLLMVIILRSGLDGYEAKTLEEVGAIMKLTRERVRQIQKKAREKLQNNPAMKAYIYDKKVPEITNVVKSNSNILFKESGKSLKEVFSVLPLRDQELLKKRYGEDLVTTINYDMTLDELSYIYRVIVPRVKQLMSESRLEELEIAFGDYVKEVEEKCLNNNEKEIIKKYKLVSKITEEKIEEGIINNLNGRSLYSFFPKYDPEMVDLVIDLFFSESIRLLEIFFDSKESKSIDKVVDRLIKIRRLLEKGITLYDLFPNIRKIFIDKIVDNLNNDDKEILKLAFGENYNGNLKVVDINALRMVIDKIKVLVGKRIGNINITYLFPQYTNLMIKEVAKKSMSKEDYELLVYYFGENLDEGVYIYDKNLRRILDIIYKTLNNKIITLNEYIGLNNITIFEYLTEEDEKLLRLALGNNYYDNPVNNFLYPEESVKFKILINKLRKQKGIISIINLLDLTDEYYNAVYETLLSLNEEDSMLLVSYLGKDPFIINKNNIVILENSLIDSLLKKIKNKAIEVQPVIKGNEGLSFYRYIDFKDKGRVLDGVNKLSKEEIEIISSVFGYNFLESSVLKEYDYEKWIKLNIVKDNLLTIISKLKTPKNHKTYGFYEYFKVNKEDRFYIEIVLDSLEPYKLEIIKKKYGNNFLNDDVYKNGLISKEFDALILIRKTFKQKVEFLKKQEEENKNYFFDEFLKIDREKYYNVVKANIEDLNEYNKALLVSSFGKHYLDYPLDLRKESQKIQIMNLRGLILKGITINVNLFYDFLGISLEDKEYLEIVVDNLTPLQRLALEERFGKDFLNNPIFIKVGNNVRSTTTETRKKILSDIEKLKNGLSLETKIKLNKQNALFDYLELDYDIDKELVEEAINALPENLKRIIILKFGEYYINNPVDNDIKGMERFLSQAKRKIKDYINFKPKEFYEYIDLTKEDMPYIEKAVKSLSNYRLEILKKKYGNDFLHKVERPRLLSKNESANLWGVKHFLVKKVEELKKKDLDTISLNFNYCFNYLRKYLVISDALILCLYLGVYDRKFTIKEIAFFFGTDEKIMLLKIKEIIGVLKQYQDDNIQKLLLNIDNI